MLGVADDIAEKHLRKVKIKSDFISASCPFHGKGNEGHPSFWISRMGGNWGCFTCGIKGDDLRALLQGIGVASFSMEAQLDEALIQAKKYKELEAARRKSKARKSFAGTYILPDALLGVFDWMPLGLVEAGYNKELLQAHDIGFDQRYDRVTFPIRDALGGLVGVSGRATMVGDVPKYLIYSGKRELNGKEVEGELGQWYPDYSNEGVRDHLWRMDKCYKRLLENKDGDEQLIIVEGYKAALWLVKHGWVNTVALMGARMSQAQERIVRQLGVETFVFLDNNKPGRDGSKKICQSLALSTFPVYEVEYHEDCDEAIQPDDLSIEEIEEALSKSKRIGGVRNGIRFMGRQSRGRPQNQSAFRR